MVRWIDQPEQAAEQQGQELGDQLFASIFASAEGAADPAPFLRRFLEDRPVHVSAFGGAILTRYHDCRAVLRDLRFGNGDRGTEVDNEFGARDDAMLALRQEIIERERGHAQSMLGLDPPDHTRQRRLVSRAFTPRTVEALRPAIRRLVDELLDGLEAEGGGDAMAALATPLPVSVISQMLGVPATDWPAIREPVTDLVASLEPAASPDDLRAAMEARDVLRDYFIDLTAKRTAEPTDDLLSALIAARDDEAANGDDRSLRPGEVIAVAILLFAAGAETTTNLIGNGINQLLNHPEEMERLWARPELVPATVEEILRFDSPVQLDGRMCLEAGATFAGLEFDEGDRVITLLGAANRDPEVYDDPDRFDVERYASPDDPAEPVMSFGSGIHYCLGANLARVEGQEVFAGLVRRFAGLGEAGPRPYRRRMVLRGLETCPITVTPR